MCNLKKLNKAYEHIEKLLKKVNIYTLTNINISRLNTDIINIFMHYNLVNDKRIVPLLLECILVFTNTTSLTQIPRLFNIFEYALKFVMEVNLSYSYYIICKCIEIWINTKNIHYTNQQELFGCYLYLIENKYIDLYSFQKWLNKIKYYEYNMSCSNNITLTNFIMLRVEIFKLIELAKTKYNLDTQYSNNEKEFIDIVQQFANLDNSNHNKLEKTVNDNKLITYNYLDKSSSNSLLLIEFINSLSTSSISSTSSRLIKNMEVSNTSNSSDFNINYDDI